MTSPGVETLGTMPPAGLVTRDPPTVTITSPGSVATSDTITVTWDYSSPISSDQTKWSVQVYAGPGLSTKVYESFVQLGDDDEHLVDFQFQSQSTYSIRVTVRDHLNDFADDFQTVFIDIATAADIDPNPQVGTVYEIGINGVGYMLADNPENPYRRTTQQIEPDRFATGDTPFSESVERYSFIGHDDWTAGEGQRYLGRPGSNPSRYFYSEGIDPFERGELKLLEEMTAYVESETAGFAVVASENVFVQTDDNELTERSDGRVSGSNSAFTVGTNPILSMASDGTNWYSTDGADIYTGASTTPSTWSTVDVTEIDWIGDRLAGLDTAATDQNFTTFDDSGAEEVASGRFAFPGADLKGITAGDGHVWFGVNRTDRSEIRAWELDSSDGAFVALSLPIGESVNNLYFYQNNVFVAAEVVGEDKTKIYRAAPSEGRLTAQFVVEYDNEFPDTQVEFAGRGPLVAFSWPKMRRSPATSGIGVVDLETGGYARWFYGGSATEDVTAVVNWDGGFAFVTSDVGLHAPDTTFSGAEKKYVSSGFLETSAADLATSTTKVVDSVTLQSWPLREDSSIDIEYSVDSMQSWNDLDTFDGNGATKRSFPVNISFSSIALRFTLNRSTAFDKTPMMLTGVIQTHPGPFGEEILQVPVNCADRITGLNNVELPDSGNGAGIQRAKILAALFGQEVKYQDIDYPLTEDAELWQMVACEVTSTGMFDRHKGRRSDAAVAVVTLRRAAQ